MLQSRAQSALHVIRQSSRQPALLTRMIGRRMHVDISSVLRVAAAVCEHGHQHQKKYRWWKEMEKRVYVLGWGKGKCQYYHTGNAW